jgi:rsbT co-antagonist protein RsbR
VTTTPTSQLTGDIMQDTTSLVAALYAAEQHAQLFEALLQHMPMSASIWHLDELDEPTTFRLVAANALTRHTLGFDLRTSVGKRVLEIFPTIPSAQLNRFVETVRTGEPHVLGEVTTSDGENDAVYAVHTIPLPQQHIGLMGENITERKRAEAMLHQTIAQEETIRAQRAVLAELSTPLIPISEHIMVMPLIGMVDSHRAQQVLDSLLQGVSNRRAQVVILDITGVPVVDTQVANVLIHAAQAVKLLGTQVVLTGIRPEVAQTLVALAINLSDVITQSSLQQGIAYATSRFAGANSVPRR